METPDKHTIKFYLSGPQAIFVTRSLTTPIVQKKQWEDVIKKVKGEEKPLRSLLRHKVEMPIGSGPFKLKDWRSGAYIYVMKNETFFGSGKTISGHLLGPHIDGIIFKVYGTSDAAILALKKGSIDMFWWGIQPGYMEDLKANPDMEIFTNEKSALYYLGFNVRKRLSTTPPAPGRGDPGGGGLHHQTDSSGVRHQNVLHRPSREHLLVLPGRAQVRRGAQPGRTHQAGAQNPFDAGYTWQIPPVDKAGNVVNGEGIMLPDGKLMEKFTILTPPADYDPHRAMCGMMMQEWLRMVGIPAYSKPMAFGALIEQVKVRRDFDAFILGYGSLSLDPDYLRNFFISTNDKRRGWNMSGYNNPAFDKIANQSARTMNRDERRKLIWEMQKIIMGDVPYMPLYNPKLIEAARKGKFTGWVQNARRHRESVVLLPVETL